MIMRHGKLLWSFKSEAFYSQKITKVSNTTVRKIVLEYIHYYNCVRIQEKLNHLSLKNLGTSGLGVLIGVPFSGFTSTIKGFSYDPGEDRTHDLHPVKVALSPAELRIPTINITTSNVFSFHSCNRRICIIC